MDLSKSICCGSFLSLRYSITPAQEGKPCIKYIAYTDTKRCRQESWICQGKRTRTNSPLDSIRFQPESACESTDLSRLCVYSDIQFTPTGDEPVIKTYVSVHVGNSRKPNEKTVPERSISPSFFITFFEGCSRRDFGENDLHGLPPFLLRRCLPIA